MRGIIGYDSPQYIKRIVGVKYHGCVECTFCGRKHRNMEYVIDEEGYLFFLCHKCWEEFLSQR